MIDFFDTSALAKRYLREPGSREVTRALARGHCAVARIAYAELLAAAARACREGLIDEDARDRIFASALADFRDLTVVEIRASTLQAIPELVRRHPLRGYDAVQLACALALRRVGPAVRFWAADATLRAAAKAEGLRAMAI
ncbi:MAG: type II toxin-antitoxin system VapC family toxin [Polyangiaceae bacterium]